MLIKKIIEEVFLKNKYFKTYLGHIAKKSKTACETKTDNAKVKRCT